MIAAKRLSGYLLILLLVLFCNAGHASSASSVNSTIARDPLRAKTLIQSGADVRNYKIFPLIDVRVKTKFKGGGCPDLSLTFASTFSTYFFIGNPGTNYYSPYVSLGYSYSFSDRGPPRL